MASPAEEPPAKRAKTAEEEVPSKEEMVDAIFRAWDRDGSGTLDFEEILPHYMKSMNHQELQEAQVREHYNKFLASRGADSKVGLSLGNFRHWLGALDESKVRLHYDRHVLGAADGPYSMNINKAVDKAYEKRSLREILSEPISTIQGLTHLADDALAPLGLRTVRDLGTWRFYLLARAIVTLAEKEELLARSSTGTSPAAPPAPSQQMNIRSALDREHERKSLKHVLKLPPSAFNMFPGSADAALAKLKISTIQQLGSRKTFEWAHAMVELERYEALAPAQ